MKTFVKKILVGISLLLAIPIGLSYTAAGSDTVTNTVDGITVTLEYDIQPDIVLSGDIISYDITGCIAGNAEAFSGSLYISNYNTSQFVFNSSVVATGPGVVDVTNDDGSVMITSSNFPIGGECFNFTVTGQVVAGTFSRIIPGDFGVTFRTGGLATIYDIELFDGGVQGVDYENDDFFLYPRVDTFITKNLNGLTPQKSGDFVDYEFTVFASGAYDANNLHIEDMLPSELDCVSLLTNDAIYPATNFNAGDCSFDIATVGQNQTGTYVIRTQANNTLTFPGTLTNTGVLTTGAVQTGLSIINSPVSLDVDVLGIPDLYTIIDPNPIEVYEQGDIVGYDIEVGNSGSANVTGASFVFEYSGAIDDPTIIPQLFGQNGIVDNILNTITWNNLDIAIGTSNTIIITGLLSDDFLQNTVFGATGTVNMPAGQEDRESNTINDILTNNIDAINDVTVLGRPDITLSKSFTPDSATAHVGDDVTYILSFDNNNGTSTATGIQIRDFYDNAYFDPQSWAGVLSCGNITLNGNIGDYPVVFDVDDMLVGCNGTITITGELIQDIPEGYILTNTGIISTNTQELHEPNDLTNTGSTQFGLDAYVAIATTKTLQEVAYPNGTTGTIVYGSGDIVTFLVTVVNTGNSTFTFNTTDVLNPAGRFTNTVLSPTFPNNVGPYSTATGTITAVVIGDDVLNPFTNTVTLSGTNFSVVSVGVYTGEILGRAHLNITKEINGPGVNAITDGPYYPGDEISFRLVVENDGTRTADGIRVEDLIPAGVFSSYQPNPAVWINESIVNGTTEIYIFTGVISAGVGTYINTGEITDPTNHPGIIIDTGSSELNFNIRPKREISIDKEFTSITYGDDDGGTCNVVNPGDCPVYGSGDELIFDITVTNTGNAFITGLRIEDLNIDANINDFEFVSATNGGQLVGNDVIWTNLSLNTGGQAGDSIILQVVLRLTTDHVETLSNEVRVLTNNVPDWVNNVDVLVHGTDIVTLDKLGRAHLGISKTVLNNAINQGPYYPGDAITFHFDIRNTGTRAATGINLTDMVENNVLNLVGMPMNDITVPVGGTGFDVVFTVAGVKGQYLGEFVNTGTISDSNVNRTLQGTIIENNIDDTTFNIRPRTELTIEKTYCGMNGDCNNSRDPYGNWYDGYQDVGFRITVYNTGNIQSTGVDIYDILPNVLSGILIDNPGLFVSQVRGERDNLTIDFDNNIVLRLTGELQTEIPQQFTNIAYFDEINECTNANHIDTPIGDGCQIILNPNDSADGNILGMAHIDIQKNTTGLGQCRVDPRIADGSHPNANGLGFPGGCLPGVAMPGDTVGFDIIITNIGSRLATGITVDDLFPAGFTYPTVNGSSVLNFVSGSIQGDIYGVTPVINLNNNVFGINTGSVVNPAIVIIHITGSLVNLTGYDVNQIKTNTGVVSDPLLQSGVVVGTNGTDSDDSTFEISEYMQTMITKLTDEPAASNGVLSGDNVGFTINYANIGNTGAYFQIVDTLPTVVRHTNSIIDTTLDGQWNFTIPAAGTCGGQSCDPTSSDGQVGSYDSVPNTVSWFIPVKYLPINGYGNAHIDGIIEGVFGIVQNNVDLSFDDSTFNHSQYQSHGSSSLSSRSQIEFNKEIITSGPTQAGDLVTFRIDITNTGRNSVVFTGKVTDRMPGCLTVTDRSNVGNNWNDGNNVSWEFSTNPITIPGRPSPNNVYSLYLTGRVKDNAPNGNACFTNPFNGYFNTSCMSESLGDLVYDSSDDRCDGETGHLLQGLFSIEKNMISPNPRFTGDTVVFELIINNNSSSIGTVDVEDRRPDNSFVQYVSNDGGLTPAGGGVYSNTYTIPGNSGIVITVTGMIPDSAIPNYLGDIFVNTGWIEYNGNETATDIATGQLLTGIYVNKEILSSPYAVSGSLVDFRLSFLNYSGNPINYYHIRDIFPQGSDGLFYVNGNPIPYNINDLNNGDINPERSGFNIPSQLDPIIIDLQAQVFSDANGFTSMINEGRFEYFDHINGDLLYGSSAFATLYPIADLQVIKELTSDIPQAAGDTVSYRITLRNVGSTIANNIELKDIRPEDNLPQNGISFSPNYHREEGGNYIWDINSLNAGGTYTINVTTTLTDYTQGGQFCNTAFAVMNGEYTGNAAGNNTGTVCTIMAGTPDLRTEKSFFDVFGANPGTTGDRPQISGDIVSYSIEFGNSGNWVASGRENGFTGWTLTDNFDESFLVYDHFDNDTNGVSNLTLVSSGNGQLLFTGTDIVANSNTGQITVYFRLVDNFDSYLLNSNNCFDNTAIVALDPTHVSMERVTNNNTDTHHEVCVIGRPDLVIEKNVTEGSTGSAAGTVVRYEINYTNSGTTIATGWYIDDLLPSELTGYTFNPQPSTSGMQGGRLYVVWSGEDLVGGVNGLRPSQNGTITIEGTIENMLVADGTNIFCNTGTIYTGNGQIDMTGINNIDDACVVPGGGFYTHKDPAVQPGVSGGLVQFEFGFENNTNQNVCISMSDNLSDYGFFCYDGPNCQYGDEGVVYTRENIAIFESGAAVFTAVVNPPTYNFGTLTNTAEFIVYPYVNGSCDWLNPIETHTEIAEVVAISDVIVTKTYTSERNPQGSGDEVNFALEFKNIGGLQATGVRLCDRFPNEITNTTTNPELEAISVNSCKNGFDNRTINPGQTLTVNITSQLSGEYNPGYQFCNTGEVYPYGRWFTGAYDPSQFDGRTNPHIDEECVTVEGTPDVRSTKYFTDVNGVLVSSGQWPRVSGDSVFYRIDYGNSGDQSISGREFNGTDVLFSGRTLGDIYPEFLTYSGIVSQNTNGAELLEPPIMQDNTLTFYGSGVLGTNSANDGNVIIEFVLNNNYEGYETAPENCFVNTGNIEMPVGYEAREETALNNMSGSESVCVLGMPDLWVDKEFLTGQFPEMSGDEVVYRITYGNSGTAMLIGREINDILPNYLTGFEYSSGGIISVSNPYDVTWTGIHLGIPNGMPINYIGEIVITGYLADNYPEGSGFCNTGFVYDEFGNELVDRNTGNNVNPDPVCSIIGGAVDMSLVKTGVGTVGQSGDTMRFQLNYYNEGTTTATGPITVIDYLPAVFDFVPGSSVVIHSGIQTTNFDVSSVNYTTGTVITRNINTDLVNQASGMIDFEVMLNQDLSGGTSIINTGYVVAFDPEPDYQNNYSVVELFSSYLPEVAINKELIQNGSGSYGDEVVFVLNFINNGILGSGDATGAWITDTLPTGFNFTSPLDCSVQLATVVNNPGIPAYRTYSAYPGNPICQTVTIGLIDYIQVQNFVISGQIEGRVLLTGTLDFQPLSEFCYTNTGGIENGYHSGSERINLDFYTGNNLSTVSACMEPQFGVLVSKTAYPEREGLIDTTNGLDISGSTVGFEIEVLNNGEIAITGTSLYDILQSSGLPTNYFTRLTSSTTLPPANLLNNNIFIQPGESGHYYLTGILNTRNRGAFYNSGVFTYEIGGESLSVTGGILIEEPNICGDYILSMQEACEQLSGGNFLVADPTVLTSSGDLLPGLICNASCEIEMDFFTNTALMCDNTFTPPICLTGTVTGYLVDEIPELLINKTAIGGVYSVGDEVWFNIQITNTGSEDAYNVMFTDNRPADIIITRVESAGIINTSVSNLLTNLGTIQAGHSINIRIYGTIDAGVVDNISNTAYVTADGLGDINDSAIIQIDNVPPPPPPSEGGVGLVKTTITNTTLYSGDEARFSVVITNTGELDAYVLLTDTRPLNEIEFGGWTVTPAGIVGNLQDGWIIHNLPAFVGEVTFIMTGKVIVDEVQNVANLARIQGTYLETTSADLDAILIDLEEMLTEQHGAAGDGFDLTDSDSVIIGQNQSGGCESIGPDKDIMVRINEGDTASVPFTCIADSEATETAYIELFCDDSSSTPDHDGNGTTLSENCEYTTDGVYHPYCTVNGQTQTACEARVDVRENTFAVCGDGILEGTEQCDLYDNDSERKVIDRYGHIEDRDSPNEYDDSYASISSDTYYCDGCAIDREGQKKPVVTPPSCMYTDVPLSVQEGEILPFRWNVGVTNTVGSESECSDSPGSIIEPTMKCVFNIYRKGYGAIGSAYKTIERDCVGNYWEDDKEMIRTFKDIMNGIADGYTTSINHALGNYLIETKNRNTDIYGEYKISLDRVNYDYCDDGGNVQKSTTKRVCQSNFALTKPYLIQKGATTTLSDTSLDDFRNMEGDQIMENIDLDKVKTTQLSHYDGGSDLTDAVNILFNKFDDDKITIETEIDGLIMKKVKGKNIFIVGNGDDDLVTYIDENPSSTPMTVLVKGDLVIKGDIITPTMFIVEGEVGFKVSKDIGCNKDQEVNGIIVAKEGFMSVIDQYQIFDDENEVSNQNVSLDNPRCMEGGLHIKGVLIGNDIDNILKNKRSHLNDRFRLNDNSKTIEEERRDEIYDGAAVLIEHNPDLRLNLPPGAAYIQDTLKTRR